jgi:hypothetical protein
LAAAEATFRLNRCQNGSTVREHLEAVERRTGERPKELDECYIPKEAVHIWNWFLDLHAARTSNGFGSNPITFAEISAWSALTGARPSEFEVGAIRRLDVLYISMEGEGAKKK